MKLTVPKRVLLGLVAAGVILNTVSFYVVSAASSTSVTDTLININKIKQTDTSNSTSTSTKISTENAVINVKTGNATVNQFKNFLQTKTATKSELTAFGWSFIISQFSTPFYNNLADTLNTSVFQQLSDQGITINSNPAVSDGFVDSQFTSKLVINSANMQMVRKSIIADLAYMPLYNYADGSTATVANILGDNNGLETAGLYFLDKYYYMDPTSSITENDLLIGSQNVYNANKQYITDSINSLNTLNAETTSSDQTDLKNLKYKEVKIPAYLSSDITTLYNQIFVQNYVELHLADIKKSDAFQAAVSGDKNGTVAMHFIETIASDPLSIDSYGDVCYLDANGDYVMLYPNYANPIFTAKTSNLQLSIGACNSSGFDKISVASDSDYQGIYQSHYENNQLTGRTAVIAALQKNGLSEYSSSAAATLISSALGTSGYSNLYNSLYSTTGETLLSNEKMFAFNKAIATLYSTNIRKKVLATAPTNLASGTTDIMDITADTKSYMTRFIPNLADGTSTNFGNQLIFTKSPSMCAYVTDNVNPFTIIELPTAINSTGGTSWGYEKADATISALPVPTTTLIKTAKTEFTENMELSPEGCASVFIKFVLAIRGFFGTATGVNVLQSFLAGAAKSAHFLYPTATDGSAGDAMMASQYLKQEYSTANLRVDDDFAFTAGMKNIYNDATLTTVSASATTSNDTTGGTSYTTFSIPTKALDMGQSWNIYSDNPKGMFEGTLLKYQTGNSSANYRLDTIYYFIRDNRVSNKWEEYPAEDVSMTSFVWLNYYLSQLNFANVTFLSDTNSELDSSAVLLPYQKSASADNKVLFAASNETTTESLSDTASKAYGIKTQVAEFSPYTLVLGLMKNTDFDKLTASTVSVAAETTTPSNLLQTLGNFFKSPLTAIGNIIAGFLQWAHDGIAVGQFGQIFNISWISDTGFMQIVFSWYWFLVGILIVLMACYKLIRNSVDKSSSLGTSIAHIVLCIVMAVLPMVVFYGTIIGYNKISDSLLNNVTNKMALEDLEINNESKIDEDLGFEQQYQLFRQQFSTIQTTYDEIRLQLLNGWNDWDNTPVYSSSDISLKTLSDQVAYDQIANIGRVIKSSGSYTATNPDPADLVPSAWYSCKGFVPVHENLYKNSLYYYFYDWIKSQYLSYFATIGDTTTSTSSESLLAFENYAKQMSFGTEKSAIDNEKSIFADEQNALINLKGGVSTMYNDVDYVYGKSLAAPDGYLQEQDLFGLGYLFKTNSSAESDMIKDESTSDYSGSNLALAASALRSDNLPLGFLLESPYWKIYSQSMYLQKQALSTNYLPPFSSNYIFKYTNDSNFGRRSLLATTVDLDKASSYVNSYYSPKITPLEYKLIALNAKIYKDVVQLLKYHQTSVRDASLMNELALVCTFDFNSEFGGYKIDGTTVQPTKFTGSSMDLDKLIRVMYTPANMFDTADTNSIFVQDGTQTIYMIYDRSFGIITAIVVVLAELLVAIVTFFRMILLWVIFILAAIFSLLYYVIRKDTSSKLWYGVLVQIMALFGCQFVTIWMLSVLTDYMSTSSDGMLILYSLGLLILFAANLIVTGVCVWMIFKDATNVGGSIAYQFSGMLMDQIKGGFRDMFAKHSGINAGNVSILNENKAKSDTDCSNGDASRMEEIRDAAERVSDSQHLEGNQSEAESLDDQEQFTQSEAGGVNKTDPSEEDVSNNNTANDAATASNDTTSNASNQESEHSVPSEEQRSSTDSMNESQRASNDVIDSSSFDNNYVNRSNDSESQAASSSEPAQKADGVKNKSDTGNHNNSGDSTTAFSDNNFRI